jgi:hypothetical protein
LIDCCFCGDRVALCLETGEDYACEFGRNAAACPSGEDLKDAFSGPSGDALWDRYVRQMGVHERTLYVVWALINQGTFVLHVRSSALSVCRAAVRVGGVWPAMQCMLCCSVAALATAMVKTQGWATLAMPRLISSCITAGHIIGGSTITAHL